MSDTIIAAGISGSGVPPGWPKAAPTVLVMLKAPRPGEVKTRLAAEVGDAEAARVYRLLVERQMRAIPDGWPVEVHFAPAHALEEMRAWLGPRPLLQPQPDGDLGRRLAVAVDAAFARGATGVVLIGGDCPALGGDVLLSAAGALGGHEMVLGPAGDGGFYLLGLTRPRPGLFVDIPWSTATVCAATVRKAATLGLAPWFLPVLDDVDTLADLEKHRALVFGQEGAEAESFPR